MAMGYVIKCNGEVVGRVVSNMSMTDDEVCEYAGINLIKTKEDTEKDNYYDIDDLEIFFE